jgi:putative tryptophan/tyrosine transport system substrate-binding protein
MVAVLKQLSAALSVSAGLAALAMLGARAWPVGAQTIPSIPRAHDGTSLVSEPLEIQATFSSVWGDRAAAQWIEEHNASLTMGRAAHVPRIAYLTATTPPAAADIFLRELRDLGYVLGKDIVIEWRVYGQNEAVAGTVNELSQSPLDLIVGAANPASRATAHIPILQGDFGDRTHGGIITDPDRPEGNITGFALAPADVWERRLTLIKTTLPTATRVGFLWNPNNIANPGLLREAQAAAPALGLEIISIEVGNSGELEAAFATAVQLQADALLPTPAVSGFDSARMAQLARQNRLPVLSPQSGYPQVGGLMAHAPNPQELPRRLAGYADQILKGTRVADLPVGVPTQFDLVLNLQAAESIGLTFPASIVSQATEMVR